MDVSGKKVLVTGGAGFLGQYVVKKLKERGVTDVYVSRRDQFNLTREKEVERLYTGVRPEIVIHLAAVVGGIGANQANPGSFLYENLIMGTMLMEYGRRAGVEKFVGVGTICSYPKFAPIPFREEDLWNGYPEEINAPYGLAKKILLVQGQAYRQQYNFNAIHLMPVNLYGPGDNFDPDSSHVIPALIRKCIDAIEQGSKEIICWGDGTPTREFLYAEDCAEAVILAMENYEGAEPVNIGAGFEISIKNLVELIAEQTEFHGRITWDTSKPNGQPRRCLDTTRALENFGFRAEIDFREGIHRTIEWYKGQSEYAHS